MRTPLNQRNNYTIRFKSQYPTFEKWQFTLLKLGVPLINIDEDIYLYLLNFGGTAYLKYNTTERNDYNIGLSYKMFYEDYIKQQQLYDQSLDKLVKSISEVENKLYTVNKSKEDDLVFDNFIDNRSTSKIENSEALIKELNNLKDYYNSLTNPLYMFYNKLISAIYLPYQPETRLLMTEGNIKDNF